MNSRPTHGSDRLQAALVAVFVAAVSAFSLWLFLQRRWWLPELASVHGGDFDSEFDLTLAITGFMFVAIHLALAYLAIRFRAGRSDTKHALPGRRFELRFAIVASTIVFLVDISLFATSEDSLRRLARTSDEGAVQVEVVAEQFAWNIRYPGPDGQFGRTDPALIDIDSNPLGIDPNDPAGTDDILRLNEMHLPVDRVAAVYIRSKDVIHSFALPNFRVRQDAVPGMTITTRFEPNRVGQFEIMCAQLCGLAHYRMRGFLTIESEEDFEQWLLEEF